MNPARNIRNIDLNANVTNPNSVAILLGGLAVMIVAGLVLSFPAEVFAQGCAMCKLSAEAAGERAARALDYGIFVLMAPAVIAFLGLFYWAFTHRDEALVDQMEAESGADPASQPNST